MMSYNEEIDLIESANPLLLCPLCFQDNIIITNIQLYKEQVFLETKCDCNKTILHFSVNQFYDKMNHSSEQNIKNQLAKDWSIPQFNSISSLKNYISETLQSIQFNKKVYLSKIKESSLNKKKEFINIIEKEYNRNISINLQCYKLLHLLLYNYIIIENNPHKTKKIIDIVTQFFFSLYFFLSEKCSY